MIVEIDLHPKTLGVCTIVESEFGAILRESFMKKILITGDLYLVAARQALPLLLLRFFPGNNKIQTFKVGMDYIDPS